MLITVDLPDIEAAIEKVVQAAFTKALEDALAAKQITVQNWPYYTLKETSELLQVKTGTLLDKRMPFLNEIEYSQSGKIFWFKKTSVEEFIATRHMRKYRRN
jgi:hypothetical protein